MNSAMNNEMELHYCCAILEKKAPGRYSARKNIDKTSCFASGLLASLASGSTSNRLQEHIDPDRAVERLMRKWLEEEARKLARKEKAPRELARVLRFKRPRGT